MRVYKAKQKIVPGRLPWNPKTVIGHSPRKSLGVTCDTITSEQVSFLISSRSSTEALAARAAAPCQRSTHPCCLGSPIRTPRLCGLPRLRPSGKNPPPPHQQPTRFEPGGISETLGIAAGPSPDGPGLLRASLDPGKATRSGPQTKGRCGSGTGDSGIRCPKRRR